MLRLRARARSSRPRRFSLRLSRLSWILALLSLPPLRAQQPPPDLLMPQAAAKKHDRAKQQAKDAPGPHPTAEIPLQQLGYASPSIFHLGDRWVQSSLDFLDEDHLLFTFRVPGLVIRDPLSRETASGDTATEGRNIRALVLAVPSGRVEVEALWRLHDYAAYLWPLTDGRFLLRDRNLLQVGDASLHLEPFLRFPGAVKYLELDPAQTMLVTQNLEPRAATPAGGAENNGTEIGPEPGSIAGHLAANHNPSPSPGPDTASSVLALPSRPSADARPQDLSTYLRVFRMADRKILVTTHIPGSLVHVAIDGHGYYDVTRNGMTAWQILYHDFDGTEYTIGQVESSCTPPLDVLAPGIVLASACDDSGGRLLTALTRDMRRLWQARSSATHVWPLVVTSASGLRVARATLDLTHAITATTPLDDPSDIRSQTVQVFDVATGKVAITGPTKPILDGGGGFALSPSGNRFAVLNEGAIQIYDLPPAPPLPAIAAAPR